MLFTSLLQLALFFGSSEAIKTGRTFAVNRFYGKGPLTTGRADPIISPGAPSSHHHTIQGGNAFSLVMSDDALLSSTCTSSLVKNDKSNYWYPSLFFQDPKDGSFTPVPMFYQNVYYFFEATDDDIKAFQPGHRMVVGNPRLRSPPATGGQLIIDTAQGTPQPVQWTCPRSNTNTPLYPANSDGLHGTGIQDPRNTGAGVGFSDKNCDGYASPLRMDIHFPSCFNPEAGIDAFEENMQFPSSAGVSAGGMANCPPGWVHTPHIFYEVYWNTEIFKDRWTQGQGTHPWVLSNGDSTGYSSHADFISGWDVATLQQVIDNCNTGDGGMDTCPGLIGGLNDPGNSCTIPDMGPEMFVIDTSMTTIMSALPGDNPVTGYGSSPGSGGPAPGPGTGSGTTAAAPKPSSSAAPAPQSSSKAGSAPGNGGSGSKPASSASPETTKIAQIPTSTSEMPAVKSSSSPASSAAAAPTSKAASTSKVAPTSKAAPVSSSVKSAVPSASPDSSSKSSPASSAAPETTASPTATPSHVSVGDMSSTTVYDCPSSTATANATSPSITGWSAYGCFSDALGSGNRVLSGVTFANINGKITNEDCVAYCDGKGFSMAGTEYGGQCFCGNALVGSTELSDDSCNMACEGDATQMCGGHLALTVYKKNSSSRRRRHLSGHKHKHLSV